MGGLTRGGWSDEMRSSRAIRIPPITMRAVIIWSIRCRYSKFIINELQRSLFVAVVVGNWVGLPPYASIGQRPTCLVILIDLWSVTDESAFQTTRGALAIAVWCLIYKYGAACKRFSVSITVILNCIFVSFAVIRVSISLQSKWELTNRVRDRHLGIR